MVQPASRISGLILFSVVAATSVCLGCHSDNLGIYELEDTASQCQDGKDNDGDGLVDCDDPDCKGFIFCVDAESTDSNSNFDLDTDSGTDSGTDSSSDTGSDTDSETDTETDSDIDTDTSTETCDESNFDIAFDPIEILIVFDKSGSMETDLLAAATSAITQVTAETERYVDYGFMYYPIYDPLSACVNPTTPQVPIGTNQSGTIATTVNDLTADGGTPTAATLGAALTYMLGAQNEYKKYVLLMTDGAPNCGTYTPGCVTTGCTSTNCCLDDTNTYNAAAALFNGGNDPSFPVYVLGVGGATAWEDVMNGIAQAGGTDNPATADYYYPAENPEDILDTIRGIVASVIPYEFVVDWNNIPQGASDDPDLVNFYCKENDTDPSDTDNLVGKDVGCASGDGWDWTSDTDPVTGNPYIMQLCPDACQKLKNFDCSHISAVFGCE